MHPKGNMQFHKYKARAKITELTVVVFLLKLKLMYNCSQKNKIFCNDSLLQATSDKTSIVLFFPPLHNGWDGVMMKKKEGVVGAGDTSIAQ